MQNQDRPSPLRIPVRLVDGQWEFFCGGEVPLRDGAVAELVVERADVIDKAFLRAMKKRSEARILNEGAELMMAFSIRSGTVPEGVRRLLRSIDRKILSGYCQRLGNLTRRRCVSVCIGEPGKSFSQRRPGEPGGLYVQLAGLQPAGMDVSSIVVPGLPEPNRFDSLNQAYTRLSEIFEPWRSSHTGNVYEYVLYRGKSGKWQHLGQLRSSVEAAGEHQLVRQRWQDLLAQASLEAPL